MSFRFLKGSAFGMEGNGVFDFHEERIFLFLYFNLLLEG